MKSDGSTEIYSPILRNERQAEQSALRARVRLDGRFVDVDLAPELASQAAEAQADGGTFRLGIVGRWVERDGTLCMDHATAKITAIHTWRRASGEDVLEGLRGTLSPETAEAITAGDDALGGKPKTSDLV